MTKTRVAILGAGSHIARGLTANLLARGGFEPTLFSRSAAATAAFVASLGIAAPPCRIVEGYRDFAAGTYDWIVNCVGAGTPAKLGNRYSDWFTLTEEFDNRCIDYLRKVRPAALYVNFSSGAVYGKNGDAPVTEHTANSIMVNQVPVADYYSIVRLNSETKHRSMPELRIADLRIFSYFSRFADPASGYFMTELAAALLEKREFVTGARDIVRDYVHPDDLFELIVKCAAQEEINAAFDVYSAAPVGKFELLARFAERFDLKWRVDPDGAFAGPNGSKDIYCSNFRRAAGIGYRPVRSSLETVETEMAQFLSGWDQRK